MAQFGEKNSNILRNLRFEKISALVAPRPGLRACTRKASGTRLGCSPVVVYQSAMGDLSYDDFSRWKVPELKDYLRDRGLKTTGRKVELVALAYGANQMGVDTKRSSIEEKVKNKQDYSALLKINDDTIPDPLFLKGWVSEQSGITQCIGPLLCTLILPNICLQHPTLPSVI